MSRADAEAAGALRLRSGIVACESDGDVWLRGEGLSDELDLALRKIPGAQRFHVDGDGVLTPVGRRVPAGTLPGGVTWQPMTSFFPVVQQPAALGGHLEQRATLRLARTGGDGAEAPASVLVTSLAAWADYATSAALVRLRRLRFAASPDGRVVVCGTPLPPLPGARYVERDGVAVPCGFALAPAIGATSVRTLLGIEPDAMALFAEDGTYELIRADDFVAASRGAARATVARLPGEQDVNVSRLACEP
jgi:hypothetical protein